MFEHIYYTSISVYFILSAALLFNLWKKKIFTFPQTTQSFSKPLTFKNTFAAFFAYLGIILLIGGLFNKLDIASHLPYLNYEQLYCLTIPISTLLTILILSALIWLLPKDTQQKIWGEKKLSAFIKGVLVAVACTSLIALYIFSITLFFDEPLEDQLFISLLKNLVSVPWLFLLTALSASILVPVAEEILFRGFLQNFLVGKWGVKVGIIVTSVIFALFHYAPSQGPVNIQVLGATFFLSLVMGILYIKERSLLANIGLHMWNNSFAILLFAMEAL
jgi:membrane protease YdiL (CAAX protease family)